jgi:hypothetical protein
MQSQLKSKRLIYLVNALIVIALLVALARGRARKKPDTSSFIETLFPQAVSFDDSKDPVPVYKETDKKGKPIGWAATGTYPGYGGPLTVLAGVDYQGNVTGIEIISHKEMVVFFRLARADFLLAKFKNKNCQEIISKRPDISGITGATKSATAIIESAREAVGKIASAHFNARLPKREYPVKFGIFETTVILLFVIGLFFQHKPSSSIKKRIRLISQIIGLIIIGFWMNGPLNLAKISSLFMGYFPVFQINIGFYLLLGGFVLSILVTGRNTHCLYVCPFGAAQRTIGLIGIKKRTVPAPAAVILRNLRGILVFGLLFTALFYNQPSYANYEPFGTLFALNGNGLHWILLGLAIVFSLFIRNPWCNFLCPMQVFSNKLRSFKKIKRK